MAAPTVNGTPTAGGTTANGNSHSVTMPTGIGGKYIVVFFACDGAPTISVATGRGWGYRWSARGTTCTGGFCYKRASSTDSDNTLTITTSTSEQLSYLVYILDGASTTYNWSFSNGSSTNPNPNSADILETTDDCLVFAAMATDGTTVASGAPTNYTNLRTRAGASTANGASISVAQRARTGITSEDPGAFTAATSQWVAWTLVIGQYHNIEELTDDFEDGSVDYRKWSFSSGTLSESGGQARIGSTSSSYSYYQTVDKYDFNDGDEIVWQMKPAPVVDQSYTGVELDVFNFSGYDLSTGFTPYFRLWMERYSDGTAAFGMFSTQASSSTNWDSTGAYAWTDKDFSAGWHRLRFDKTNLQVEWSISTDGKDWWPIHYVSLPPHWSNPSCSVSLLGYQSNSGSAANALSDQFGIPNTTESTYNATAMMSALLNIIAAG